MCKSTTPPRASGKDAIRTLPANTGAGAVIPLLSYLQKYATQFAGDLIPATKPALPPDADQNAYKRVAFSVLPLRSSTVSPYYAGVFDDDTDFSASLVKVAALFAAGELLAEAKAAPPGAANAPGFNAALKAEITANADPRIVSAQFPSGSPVGLLPKTASVLTGTGPSADFTSTFKTKQSLMIVQSDDPAAAFCIDRLGYGYISAVLVKQGFFSPASSTGIWLGGDYANSNTYVRLPCVNDHPDAQLTTTRQMCRLFSMIRLKQVPANDLATNGLMQNLLNEPKAGANGTAPWLLPGRPGGPSVTPSFTIVQDKIGFAGLGTAQTPNVYSEGLIIRWTGTQPDGTSQIDAFNKRIDPAGANPAIRLSGEMSVCWQNLLADNLPTGFDGIVRVLNNSISDFLDQKAL